MTSILARTTRQPDWRPDRLADSVILLLAVTVVQRMIGFMRGVLFCRWLEPGELGQWDMALGFIELAAPLAMLGLPGSFGRYVEHYRQLGQLRTFLRRAAFVTVIALSIAVTLVATCRSWLSQLVFGTPHAGRIVLLIAAGLLAVVCYNFLTTLLTALRRSRVVSGLEFTNSALFATLAIGLLAFWRTNAASVVAAYAGACLITSALSLACLRPIWLALPEPEVALPHRALWSKLLPFAIWVWGTNWLANLFEIADRYMIVHCGNLDPAQALVEVGNYHSSRVMPWLLVSITGLLGTMITPYLSHDWETGGRQAVSARLNLTLKLLGVCLLVGATLILTAAPLLFGVAFKGKYSGGLEVLPLTLIYCIWFGMARVTQKYLWCAERVGLAAAAWLVGLLVNIGLNFLLFPRYGLPGVVLSTAAGNLVSLLMLVVINRVLGMQMHPGTLLISAAPALLILGDGAAIAGSGLVLCAAAGTNWLFQPHEKQQLIAVANDYMCRLRRRFDESARGVLKEVT